MTHLSRLTQRKNDILSQLAALGPMRKGSLCEQFVETLRKDGSKSRRGPYTIYTCKEDGKTVSRRLTTPHKVSLYREQIAAFRNFQDLTAELARIAQSQADLETESSDGAKKNSTN